MLLEPTKSPRRSSFPSGLALFLLVLIVCLGLLAGRRPARAETMQIERVVPPGATLTYSEGGSAVRTVSVPPGRVRVTIQYGGVSVIPRHRRGPRSQERME